MPAIPSNTPLLPGPVYNFNPAFGGNPTAASPQATQGAAIGGNLAQLAQLYQLAMGAGKASGAGAGANLDAALPGASGGLEDLLKLSEGELMGQVDQPTINNLVQLGAERGVSIGSPGSPNANAALMQALGRTTQGTEQLGAQNLATAIGSTPTGPQFSPASMLVDPAQQQEAQTYSNVLSSAPVPSAAASANRDALNRGRDSGQAAATPPPAATPDRWWQPGNPYGTSAAPGAGPSGTFGQGINPTDVNALMADGWTLDEIMQMNPGDVQDGVYLGDLQPQQQPDYSGGYDTSAPLDFGSFDPSSTDYTDFGFGGF